MKSFLAALAAVFLLNSPAASNAHPDEDLDVVEVYVAFYTAQNDRNLEEAGSFLVDEDFLWVSDGRAVWGREAVLARMGRFQQAEVWNVTPDLANARVVVLSEDAALMNLTLTLEIGKAVQPSKLGFVVTIAFQKVDDAWRIAALLTTADKS